MDTEELRALTNYKRAADQLRYLREKNIPHEVSRLGKPLVRRDFLEPASAEPQFGPVA